LRVEGNYKNDLLDDNNVEVYFENGKSQYKGGYETGKKTGNGVGNFLSL
jgi:antitoxin component YwqK of YwqJK toxin-antitoxin module